jgi:hypothetical protein
MKSNVLQKLLKPKFQEKALEKLLTKERPKAVKKVSKSPGRPKKDKEDKARNFTLCLAPQYLDFLDGMTVRDPKVQGRGRKIKFIIERFIEHEKRSVQQLRVLKETLSQVQKHLQGYAPVVKKGQKLELSQRDKTEIGKVVDRVHVLLKILNYSPKQLQKLLPSEEWAILSFSLNWKANRGVVL